MTLISSPASASVAVTWTPTDYWLADPLNPSLNMLLPITAPDDNDSPVVEPVAIHRGLGRKTAIVLSDTTISGREGTLVVRTQSDTDYSQLLALLSEQRTLWYTWPQRGGRGAYIRRTSAMARRFVPGAHMGVEIRESTFSYVEQVAP